MADTSSHSHVFLGASHERNERRTWMVIALCSVMMVAEIAGGLLFGSIALVADGLHMSTHASALLLSALAYSYARRHVDDARFSFGTGKLGDLAGFASAIVLAMIAVLIGYEALTRFLWPVPIDYAEAIAIATLGLVVNVASVLLLGGTGHAHRHGGGHAHAGHDHDAARDLPTRFGPLTLEIFEDGVPPRFRLSGADDLPAAAVGIETIRSDGTRQAFALVARGGYFESVDEVPEPHAFTARVFLPRGEVRDVEFVEHEHAHGATARDNNMRAAVVHVLADAAVSLLVIGGLSLGWYFRWTFVDPAVGLLGAAVIAAWSFSLVRDTGAILLDVTPDRAMEERVRETIEADGDRLTDLHLWRLGPGHLAAILSVATRRQRGAGYYQSLLRRFRALSHVTVQVQRQGRCGATPDPRRTNADLRLREVTCRVPARPAQTRVTERRQRWHGR
jgi:cation diffusion facilitator family transporter